MRLLRAQPEARSVREPETPAFRLFVGNLQPLTPPDPFDPLVIHEPARISQQCGDLAIAVAAILPGQLDDVGGQLLFVVTAPRDLALRRAVLPERRTNAALGDMQMRTDMLNAGATTRGA